MYTGMGKSRLAVVPMEKKDMQVMTITLASFTQKCHNGTVLLGTTS